MHVFSVFCGLHFFQLFYNFYIFTYLFLALSVSHSVGRPQQISTRNVNPSPHAQRFALLPCLKLGAFCQLHLQDIQRVLLRFGKNSCEHTVTFPKANFHHLAGSCGKFWFNSHYSVLKYWLMLNIDP